MNWRTARPVTFRGKVYTLSALRSEVRVGWTTLTMCLRDGELVETRLERHLRRRVKKGEC